MTIQTAARHAYDHAQKAGFHNVPDPGYFIPVVCEKINEESDEMMDGWKENRHTAPGDIDALQDTGIGSKYFKELFEEKIKDTVEDEMVDILLVILAASVKMGFDIEKHLLAKMVYNRIREDHK